MTELRDRLEARPVDSSEIVYDGVVWDVRRDVFEFGGRQLTREVVDHPGAVAVLALDADDRVTLIRQYRHPVGAWEWELPAGLLDVHGEDPAVAAARELHEEVDLTATTWHVLLDYWSSPGGNSEALRIFLARDLDVVAEPDRHTRQDEEAQMDVAVVALDEVRDAILAGHLHNPALISGVLTACALRDRGWVGLRPADAPWPEHPSNRPLS